MKVIIFEKNSRGGKILVFENFVILSKINVGILRGKYLNTKRYMGIVEFKIGLTFFPGVL